MKPIINIAIAADSNYIVPVTVVLESIFANNQTSDVHIYLLHMDSLMKKEDILFLGNYTEKLGGTFHPLAISEEQISGFPETRHGKCTLLRLALPDLVPELDKVLYLDGDIIVKQSLLELYQTDISSYYVAGVKDPLTIYHPDYLERLGISPKSFYFNAGICLMNLKILREDHFFEKGAAFLEKEFNNIKYPDQDFLNYVSQNKVLFIPPKYNFNYNVEKDICAAIWSKEEIREARKNPIIVHFVGPIKPWSQVCIHPQRKYWWNYLKTTPFRDFQPKDKNLKSICYRFYLQLFKTIEAQFSLELKKRIGSFIPKGFKGFIKHSLMKK